MKSAGVIVWIITIAGCSAPVEPSQAAQPADRLLLLEELGPPLLTAVDLANQDTETLFAVPSGGFAYEFDVHDVTGDILLAYTAPPTGESLGYDRSRIVRIDNAGNLTEVACSDVPGVWCFYPLWAAADGAWFIQDGDGVELAPQPTLSHVDLTTGVVSLTVIGATEPAVSSDGAKVAWVGVDAFDGQRSLAVGNAKGELARILVEPGTHDDLGQPFFSADGATLYYVGISVKSASWVRRISDWLIPSAHAHQNHDTPADWWQVSVDGGTPTQLTRMNTIHYDGRADLNGDTLLIATREGVQRIDATTGDAELIVKTRTVRALDWLP